MGSFQTTVTQGRSVTTLGFETSTGETLTPLVCHA